MPKHIKKSKASTAETRKGRRAAGGSAYGLRVVGCNWPLQQMYGFKSDADAARHRALYMPNQLEVVKISWRTVK
jgi:hypothetical protein